MSEIRFNRWSHQSGTGGIYQDSSGNIGIGTSVPTSVLDIQGGSIKIGNDLLTSSGVSTFTSGLNVTGGSVGIGTDNPTTKLYATDTQNGYVSYTFVNDSNGSGAVNRIQLGNDASPGSAQLVVYGSQHSTLPNVFDINNANNNDMRLLTNNTERLRITSSGNVGIGTDNPGRLLQVYNASSNPQVNIKSATGGTCELQFGDNADEVRGNIVYNCTDDYLSLHGYNNAERLRITSSGNVGLSVTSPDLRLHVNGINALPSSSGSTPTGYLTLRNKQGGSSHGMFMGVSNVSPWCSWIQAQDANNNATNYPLLLNPNGGNVGIGTDNPASLLHLQGSAPRITFTDTAGTDDIGKIFSSSGALYLQQRDGSAHGEIIFRTENNSTAAERLRITNTGNVQIANGNLVFSTSGTGIDFSATANSSGTTTSELLDDYEEGTWTPDLRFAGSNTGVSYAWRNGHYTKIGRQVTVRGAFGLSSKGTFNATDDVFIYGLPFDVAPYGVTGGFHYMFGSAYNGYQGLFQLELQHSSSFSDHVPVSRQTAWGGAVSPMEYQDIGGSQRMAFIFSYFTAS